jgi:hypothetical protein
VTSHWSYFDEYLSEAADWITETALRTAIYSPGEPEEHPGNAAAKTEIAGSLLGERMSVLLYLILTAAFVHVAG